MAASCAIPGFYRPVKVGSRRYVDGGVCSASNLDLVAGRGLDLVICLNPLSSGTEVTSEGTSGPLGRLGPLDPRDWLGALSRQANGRRLAHEAAKVRRFGTEVLLIEPTPADHAAMGHNLMSASRRQQVIETATRTVREQLQNPERQGSCSAACRPASRTRSAGRRGRRRAGPSCGRRPFGERAKAAVSIPGAGLTGRAIAAVAEQAQRRVPAADLDERDPDYIRETLPRLWMLASLYFRAEVRGLEHIPEEGPVLMVGNHSGGNLTPDTGVFTLAFSTYFGVERRFHQLAHNLVLSMPGLGWLRKYGTVAATPQNAERALDKGAALLVYPGGDYEVHRPSLGVRHGRLRRAQGLHPARQAEGRPDRAGGVRGRPGDRLLPQPRRGPGQAARASTACSASRCCRSRSRLPWVVNVGDMFGHIPLPAKITIAGAAADRRQRAWRSTRPTT